MKKEEREVLESECITKNLPPGVAYKIGKMVGYDEVLEALEDCANKGMTLAAASIVLAVQFRPKIADMAQELSG